MKWKVGRSHVVVIVKIGDVNKKHMTERQRGTVEMWVALGVVSWEGTGEREDKNIGQYFLMLN